MKRGQLLLAIEFILGAVIVMTLLYSAYEVSNNENFVKQYVGKNVAMMMDTVMSLDGDLEINIPLDKTRVVEVGKDREFDYYRVLVDEDKNSEAVFATDLDLFSENVILETDVVKIVKEGDSVRIEKGVMGSLKSVLDVGCGFDEGKLELYKFGDQVRIAYRGSGDSDPFIQEILSDEGRRYAEDVLKIEGIKYYTKEEVENLVRVEVARKWNVLENKGWDNHGSKQEDAQRAILSYAEHENNLIHFRENEKPVKDVNTLGVMSITPDKGSYKNQFYAFAWDIKYNIFVGVDEVFRGFKNSARGEGLERWKDTIGYVFLPSNRNRYWTDSRSSVAKKSWEDYKDEKAYVC